MTVELCLLFIGFFVVYSGVLPRKIVCKNISNTFHFTSNNSYG